MGALFLLFYSILNTYGRVLWLTELLIFIGVEQEDQVSPIDHRTNNLAKHKTD